MNLPPAKDKPLFTPGPLTTSQTVRQALLRDLGSRDTEFIETVRDLRRRLLRVAGVSQDAGYEAIPMQGSGTFGIEAVFVTVTPPGGKWLVVINGAYGERMVQMCKVAGIATTALRFPESEPVDPVAVGAALDADPEISGVAVVHCETTTGIVNPIQAVGEAVRARGKTYFVDAMSSFGAVPIDFAACGIDFLVSSANKCIEGVPGFSFVIARRDALIAADGNARSLSLDLLAQWRGLEKTGQFRFTPPTHAILAFRQALVELEQEGGVDGRAARYRANYDALLHGMRGLGFAEYLPAERQGYIITSFRYPTDPRFDFERFYEALNDRGFVIYPGKVSDADCFRIGHIGRLFPADMKALVGAIGQIVGEQGFRVP